MIYDVKFCAQRPGSGTPGLWCPIEPQCKPALPAAGWLNDVIISSLCLVRSVRTLLPSVRWLQRVECAFGTGLSCVRCSRLVAVAKSAV